MKAWKRMMAIAVVSTLAMASLLAKKTRTPQSDTAADLTLQGRIRRFAPTILTANTARMLPNDRQALLKIIAAAKYYDPLYLRQIWSGNEALLKRLQADKSLLG